MPLIVFTPCRFSDSRGWLSETYNASQLAPYGVPRNFCQDNHSFSIAAGTLRGLHFQAPPYSQAKLVRCIKGRIFDVVVDIRRESPTFGKWIGLELSAENRKQLFVPVGFAHGFITLAQECEVMYKVTNFYAPDFDSGIAWDDPDLAIDWPINEFAPVISDKDMTLPSFTDFSFDFSYDGHPLGEPDEILL